VLGDADDTNAAVAAARAALPAWSATSFEQRRGYLDRLANAFAARRDDIIAALVEEFGTTTATAAYIVDQSADWFRDAQELVTEDTFDQSRPRDVSASA
jgi:aldehyde dehydrogenase (NAD+)